MCSEQPLEIWAPLHAALSVTRALAVALTATRISLSPSDSRTFSLLFPVWAKKLRNGARWCSALVETLRNGAPLLDLCFLNPFLTTGRTVGGHRNRPCARRPLRAPPGSPGPAQGLPGILRVKGRSYSADCSHEKAVLGHSGPACDAGPTLEDGHSHTVNHGTTWAFEVATLASASLHMFKTA